MTKTAKIINDYIKFFNEYSESDFMNIDDHIKYGILYDYNAEIELSPTFKRIYYGSEEGRRWMEEWREYEKTAEAVEERRQEEERIKSIFSEN